MHEERALTGGAAHQVVEKTAMGQRSTPVPPKKRDTPRPNGCVFARLRWTVMTEGCFRESTATSLAIIAGMADWDVRVNFPEQRNPKNVRQDAAHSRQASYWSPPATDHEERRCRMTEAVMGRHWLLARDWERWILCNVYQGGGIQSDPGQGSPHSLGGD